MGQIANGQTYTPHYLPDMWLIIYVKKESLIFCHCIFSGDKTLDGYQKKKYVCKLLFIFLLGHDIDFGHMEAVNLLSSNKYTEKQIVSTNPAGMRSCIPCIQFAL